MGQRGNSEIICQPELLLHAKRAEAITYSGVHFGEIILRQTAFGWMDRWK